MRAATINQSRICVGLPELMVVRRWLRGVPMLPVCFVLCLQILCMQSAMAFDEATGQPGRVAQLVFHNECAGRTACLTAWNRGEAFASLGIGHFIWYPTGTAEADKRFRESAPGLLAFLRQHGVALPEWLAEANGCPWPDRASFLEAADSPRMLALRNLLARTMPLQAAFMQQRLKHALPEILKATSAGLQDHIRNQFRRVAAAPMGVYALTDYVNFKGEGVSKSERYGGQGWGLMQVLKLMRGEEKGVAAIDAFARAADAVLSRRVENSPPEQHEARWLEGWRKRLATYPEQARRQAPGADD